MTAHRLLIAEDREVRSTERAAAIVRMVAKRIDAAAAQHDSIGAATPGRRLAFDSAGRSHLLPYLRLAPPAGGE